MNKTLQDILQSREDISDYVFHFCKKHNAKETLEKILSYSTTKIVIISIFDKFYRKKLNKHTESTLITEIL